MQKRLEELELKEELRLNDIKGAFNNVEERFQQVQLSVDNIKTEQEEKKKKKEEERKKKLEDGLKENDPMKKEIL